MRVKAVWFDLILAAALAALCLLAVAAKAPWAAKGPLDGAPFPQAAEDKIDLNTAPAAELQCLPGVGEKRALAIVAHREEHGPFAAPEELEQVQGISQTIARAAAPYVTVR